MTSSHPGCLIIPNFLPAELQLALAVHALRHWSQAPHTNITNLRRLQQLEEAKSIESPNKSDDLWSQCLDQQSLRPLDPLRWSNLGISYDWTAREYRDSLTPTQQPVADLLHRICRDTLSKVIESLQSHAPDWLLNELSQHPLITNAAASSDWRRWFQLDPQTAIVNYYPLNASMGAHADDAEFTPLSPIVSLSVGCSGIFCIGGRSLSDPATPILLRTGDVLIMTCHARLCLHSVPRILPSHNTLDLTSLDSKERELINEWLNSHRLNVTLRQIDDEKFNRSTYNASRTNSMSMMTAQ